MRTFLLSKFNALYNDAITWFPMLRRPTAWRMPTSLMIEPTNRCNYKCPMCYREHMKRPLGDMTLEQYRRVINMVQGYVTSVQPFFFGESLLHPDLAQMIAYAKSKGMCVSLSTNGFLLNDGNREDILGCGLDELVISMDGATDASYDHYRSAGKLGRVLEQVKRLVGERRGRGQVRPKLIFQFIVFRDNEQEVELARSLAADAGCDVFLVKSPYAAPEVRDHLPRSERYRGSSQPGRNGVSPDRVVCLQPWTTAIVAWDGTLLPCCWDADASMPLGNVFDQDLRKLWNGPRMRELRKNVRTTCDYSKLCRNCPAVLENWYVRAEVLNAQRKSR